MKKYIYVVLFFLFFISPTAVFAADCNNYSCIECTATFDKNVEVTFKVQSNGDGTGTVQMDYQAINNSSLPAQLQKHYEVKHTLVYANFLNDKQDALQCINKLYVKYEGINGGRDGTLLSITTKNQTGYTLGNVSVKKTNDNKKPVKKSSSSKTRSCQYNAKIITSAAASSVVGTVTRSDDKLTYSFTEGYQLNPVVAPDVTPDMISFDKNVACPKLFVYCGSNGSDKYCTVTTKANAVDESHGNLEGEEGDDTLSSNQLQSNNAQHSNSVDISDFQNQQTCEGVFGAVDSDGNFEEESLGWLLQLILNYMKIAGPVLMILFSMFEFIKAIAVSDEETMKKAQSRLVTRIIAVIILFLLPYLVGEILKLINGISNPTCYLR